jgi:hypothetical protein
VFLANSVEFLANSVVFTANSVVFAANSVVFAANSVVFVTNSVVSTAETVVSVTETVVSMADTGSFPELRQLQIYLIIKSGMAKLNILSFALIFLTCCHPNSRLEETLSQAGENRQELENVLLNYANDTLKLKAAEFLIENMMAHYSFVENEGLIL